MGAFLAQTKQTLCLLFGDHPLCDVPVYAEDAGSSRAVIFIAASAFFYPHRFPVDGAYDPINALIMFSAGARMFEHLPMAVAVIRMDQIQISIAGREFFSGHKAEDLPGEPG